MSVKTITITQDAYIRLAALKEPRESFSDVVCRLTGKGSLLDLAGILNDKETAALKENVSRMRKHMKERSKRIAEELR